MLPVETGLTMPLSPLPVASYDEQLGITFTQSFTNLSYNVTAVPQIDSNGYGPAYLLSGLSNDGYWYQAGLSYNWPYANVGGYNSGFDFNYEVFNTAQKSVYPLNSGGLTAFSGPVNSGDLVLLNLYISDGFVYMSAKDWNTGASAQESYSDHQTSSFIGLSSQSNSNGYFTGLMTEWYHATPYSGDETKVTYSNYASSLSSAYMWIDEWDPNNINWAGKWSDSIQVTFSNPTQLQPLSSNGATEFSDANQFITGSIVQQMTSITLLPAGGSTPLSATNEFAVSYTLDSQPQVLYAQDGTLTLAADSGTDVILSGVSTGSSSTEEWVMNSQGANVTVPAGSTITFYYYDILSQQVAYAISGGGNTFNPTLTYNTAPSAASAQFNQTINTISLASSQQAIMVLKGTSVSVETSVLGAAQEQWATSTSSWSISQANQLPGLIIYYHQYQVTARYSTSDGSVPSSNIVLSGTQYGSLYQLPLTTTNQAIWLDANTLWSAPTNAMSASGTERWSPSSGTSGSVTGAITINPTYVHQYYLTVNSTYGTPSGSGWYNSGATAYAALSSGIISGGTGTQYVFNSWTDAASGSNYTQSNGITMRAPVTATATWITQYYLMVNSLYGSPSGSGWYNAGATTTLSASPPVPESIITQHVCTSWTGTGSVPANGTSTSLDFTINQPSSITWNWQSQFISSTVTIIMGVPLLTAIIGLSIYLMLRNNQKFKKPKVA